MKPLRAALEEYLSVRRAFGSRLREPGLTLLQFLEFLENEGSDVITNQLALRWAMLPVGVQRATWARRLSMVRKFAAWRSAFDPRTEVPPKGLLSGHRQRTPPHIYTENEATCLMAEAARLQPSGGIRPWTYITLIGLLASTGLRPGEALALDVADVDLREGVLAIRESKFGKSRFVPVSESTRMALLHYANQRATFRGRIQTQAFLVSEEGRRILGDAARRTFCHLSVLVGLRPGPSRRPYGRGPRLQDFRHTFATRVLIGWYRAGADVSRELPKLSTFLGHSEVCHTYWYLQAIPELLQVAAQRLKEGGEEALR